MLHEEMFQRVNATKENVYDSTFLIFFLGYLHILLHTFIVIGVISCSTDPNNNKIEK
jgi:hypothetical protein